MKRVLMLGAGPLQVPAIRSLKNLGCYVVCADYNPRAEGLLLADRAEIVSTIDQGGVLKLAREVKPDYVITSTTDAPVRTAAFVSEQLGLFTGISYRDSICATQKDAMRDRLSEAEVPIPSYRACRSFGDFLDALEFFEWNCVVKPADSAASRGVILVDRSLLQREARQLYDRELPYSRKGVLMVEEKMTGPEVSVEGITVAGRSRIVAITDKIVTDPPFFVELGHSEQSSLPPSVRKDIADVALDAIKAVGIWQGPSHTEIMVTPRGPKVVEIAARLGGDYITSRLVPLSTGVDLVSASICSAIELPVDVSPRWDRGSAILFITAESGVISHLEIDRDARSVDGFEEACLYKSVGDEISSPHSSGDRIGHVICSGEDARAALESAKKVRDGVRLMVRPLCQ